MTALDELNRIKSFVDSLKCQRIPDDFEYGSIVVKKSKSSVWMSIEIDFKVNRHFLPNVLTLVMKSGMDCKISFESIGEQKPLIRIEVALSSDCISNSDIKPILEELKKMVFHDPLLMESR